MVKLKNSKIGSRIKISGMLILLATLLSCHNKKSNVIFYPQRMCFNSSNAKLHVMELNGFNHLLNICRCGGDILIYNFDTIPINSNAADSLIKSKINYEQDYSFRVFELRDGEEGGYGTRYKGIIESRMWEMDSILIDVYWSQ
jgi:hypothetical protein